MKNVLFKELMREIYKTRGRYLSILAIVAIGCGFFAGVKSSCPDMKLTAEKYYQQTNLSDLHILSSLGFDESDVAAIKEISNAREVMPGYSADVFINAEGVSNVTVKLISCDKNDPINHPVIVEGRFPETKYECLVESSNKMLNNIKIGSKIFASLKSSDISEILSVTEFEVVGFAKSSNYVNFEHGNTLIGDGQLDSFIFVNPEAFSSEVYTDIYLTLSGTENMSPFDDQYNDFVQERADYISERSEQASKRRYDSLVSDANEEIASAKKELSDAEKEAEDKLSEAKIELDDGLRQIEEGQAEYQSGLETYNNEISKAEAEIWSGRADIADAKEKYQNGLEEYNTGLSEFEEKKSSALAQLTEYEKQLLDLQAQISDGESQLASAQIITNTAEKIINKYSAVSISFNDIPQEEIIAISQFDFLIKNSDDNFTGDINKLFTDYITEKNNELKAQYGYALNSVVATSRDVIEKQNESLENAKKTESQLSEGIRNGYADLEAAEKNLSDSKRQLDAALEEIESGENTIEQAEAALETEKANGLNKLAEAKKQLEEAQAEYENGLAEYEKSKAEVESELAEGRKKIDDAEAMVEDIPEPEWYVFDRSQNPGYSSYKEDAEKVDAIAAVFPFFFVLVAALVCSTTMSRMVEEERIQMGTLKALGYSNRRIILKYILYAVSASIIGSAIGLSIGFKLFPSVIINAYNMMYRFPEPITPFRWNYAIACTVVGVLCTGITAFTVSYRSLKIVPSQLMRPKAPKMGKRVLLERIGFIWKRLNFSYKVTVRNIGRYKKRSLMTIVGIAGCTALMLTGFGLRYAIGVIAERQFSEVYITDATVITSDKVENFEELHRKVNEIEGVSSTAAIVYKTIDVSGSSYSISANLIVPQTNEGFSNFIILNDCNSGSLVTLDDTGVVINEKLAKLLGVSYGDTMTINISEGHNVDVRVSGIVENYALNYVYVSPGLYCKIYGTDEVPYNGFFLNKSENADSHTISEHLLENDDILGVSFTENTSSTFVDTVQTLNSIVWVIILSAGALAFIVMYNLMNINVNERRYELATIKVLGFYDNEVSAYIYRENNIAVAAGIIIGLIAGIFLERFVVATAEVDVVMFATDINAFSYIISAALTIVFAAIVTFLLHFKLKKISMVESMKAIE